MIYLFLKPGLFNPGFFFTFVQTNVKSLFMGTLISVKRVLLLVIIVLSGLGSTFAGQNASVLDDEPVMVIHDTVVAPGELLLQLDALNFTGANGQVSAITLKIAIDTNLLHFIGIQNQTLSGSWLANYNYNFNEISIIYTAPFGTGNDIDGKLLDLHLFYYGGFPDSLLFKNGCEVSNVNLQTIETDYDNGSVSQITAVGEVSQDSLSVHWGDAFLMPVIAEGSGYDQVNQISFRSGYDTAQLQYLGTVGSLLTGVQSVVLDSVVTSDWQDDNNPVNLVTADTLFFLKFKFIGDTCTKSDFLPGSKVYNNAVLVPSDFYNGFVTVDFLVDIVREPDTGGVTSGEGYYKENDTVTVVATPATGFHFINWVLRDSVVSTDTLYSYVKDPLNDTLTANFEPNSYTVTLAAVPPEGGTVTGGGTYSFGESVTVIADPSPGYDFICWVSDGDTVSYDSEYTFVMPNHNVSLSAHFQIETFSITAVPNNMNWGTTSGGGLYNYGDSATVIATPYTNYKFVVWTDNGQPVSYDSLYTFFVDSDRDLFANFQYDAVCSAPVGLFVDSLSDSTAMLHWVPSGQENKWDLIWGEYGFDTLNGGNLVEGLLVNYYFLTGLNSGTVYDFYVRAVCTDEEHSVWAGPYTFTTWYEGVENINTADQVVVYPNPARGVLKVSFREELQNHQVNYRIVNSIGRIELENLEHGKTFSINLANLPSGIYFLQLQFNGKSISKLFVIQ